MRRHSILGPIVMVTVGIVFLLVQTGHLQSDHLWDWYGHWWPLLLVLAGAVLLAEWALDQARPQDPQQPYARRSIGGGVFSLLALLAFVGLIVGATRNHREYFVHGFGLSPDNLEEFLGDKHESDQSFGQAFPAGGSLSVDNPRGDVSITGISTDNQIHISLHKQVYSRSDSDAENKARELSPKVSTNGNIVSVSLPTLSGAVADITISVPASAATTVNANHGDVQVNQLKAPVTITANHGDVSVTGITGSVLTHVNNNGSSFSAHNITGPVSLEGHVGDLTLSDINGPVALTGEIFGSTHLEHITNSLKLHTSRTDFQLARLDGEMDIGNTNFSADQCVGPVVLTTGNRNITLERITGDLSVTNRNGSVDLTSAPPMGNVTVQNRNGSVSLTVPDHANFTVSAETSDGDVDNDFSLSSQDRDNRKTLNGTVGKGGPLVRITTSQGDIKLKKAKMEDALKSYGVASDYGVADVATAATYQIAEMYHDFGRALLASQRPKGLSKDELEQYNVLLEEQAFPFEEKAIELHEVNARRSAKGIYDQWVRNSYAALGELRPVRYGKNEESETAIDAIR